jgi:hypothetical protein
MKRNRKRYPQPPKRLEPGDLIVDTDWGSSGIWECTEQGVANNWDIYQQLPAWLVERFNYWTAWSSLGDPRDVNRIDFDLFRAYGRSLAVDLKRLVGNRRRVFYGFRADNARRCQVSSEEIILPDECKGRLPSR